MGVEDRAEDFVDATHSTKVQRRRLHPLKWDGGDGVNELFFCGMAILQQDIEAAVSHHFHNLIG